MSRQPRVSRSDRSIAINVLYGHPDGSGGLRLWSVEEIAEEWKMGYRWALVIHQARSAFIDRADDHRYGNRTKRKQAFARFVARVRDSDRPEIIKP